MEERRRHNWREDETLEAAARRLWRDWDERIAKKKAAEALESSAKIADQQLSPAEKADGEESALGLGTLDPRRQQLTVASWEEFSDGCEKGGGRATMGIDQSFAANGCARPDAPGSTAGSKDRAVTRPGGLD